MSTDPTTTEQIRAVLLAAVMILSVVAATTALAGSAAADGGTTDALDIVDIEDVDLSDTDDEESDDSDQETTESDDEESDDSGTTDGDAGSNEDGNDEEDEGSTDSNGDSSDENESGSASATPTEAGVTAGATNQSAVSDDGETALTFAADDDHAFPDSGTVTLSVPDESAISFDVDNSSVDTDASSGISVDDVELTANELRIDVDETDGGDDDSLTVDGLVFEVPEDASTTELTWAFGDASDQVTLAPERLETTFDGASHLPRGADSVPEDGIDVLIGADENVKHTDGFHDEDEFIAVRIPEHLQDDLEFDLSSEDDVTIETFGPNCDDEFSLVDAPSTPADDTTMSESVFFFVVDCDVSAEDDILVQNLRLNSSGVDLDETAEFDSLLDVEYVPVDALSPVTITTEDDIPVVAPEVAAGGVESVVEANTTATAGDESIRATVTDEHGGLVAADTELVVSLADGEGVTFNESQSVEVETDGDSIAATVESVSADAIVLEIEETSDEGGELTIQGTDGEGLLFDVSEDATGVNTLAVTTSPGDHDVKQATDGSVAVAGDESDDDDEGDESDESDDSDESDNGDEGDESDESDEGDESDESDEGDESDESDDSDESDNGDESDESDEGDESDETTAGGGGGGGGSGAAPGENGEDDDDAGESDDESIDGNESAEDEQETVASDSSSISDDSTGDAGPRATFEGVPVGSITFGEEASGQANVSVLDALPQGVEGPDGNVLYVLIIEVAEDVSDEPATIGFEVGTGALAEIDADADAVQLARYDEDAAEWAPLETRLESTDGNTASFAAETPGFSLFMVYAEDTESTTPTPTETATETPEPRTETPGSTPTDDGETATGTAAGAAEEAGFDSVTIAVLLAGLFAAVLSVVGVRALRRA